MPGEEETRGKRHGQPFVRIEGDGVGLLNSAHQAAVPVREKNSGSISAIDVEPDVIASANLVNQRNFINRARARRSGSSYNAEWLLAGRQIFFDRYLELLHIELQALVYRNSAERPASQPQQACGLIQRMMPFHRCIKNRLSANGSNTVLNHIRKARGERHGQRAVIRFVSACGKRSAGSSSPSDQVPDPANGFSLDS